MVIYTTPGCGKCKILKKKLESKHISYDECQDVDKMQSMGLSNLPVLEVDGELLPFSAAVEYVNER